jgi:cell division septal protein FtsQ
MENTTPQAPPQQPTQGRNAALVKRRKRTLRKMGGVLLGMALLYPLTSPYCRVRKIDVEVPQSQLLPQEEALLKENLRISKYTNWVLAPVDRMKHKIQRLPFVKTAKVRHQLPNHLVASVVPREPFAILNMAGAKYEIDDKGYPIRPAREEMAQRLPEVFFAEAQPITLGQQMNAFVMVSWLPLFKTTFGQKATTLQKIEVDPKGNLCLNMKDGLRVQWGQGDMLFAERTALLQELYQREATLSNRFAELILIAPDSPACRPRVAAGGAPPPTPKPPPST